MSKKIDWTNHIIEFVTVVIGILLAFGLNNYNESRQEKARAKEYMLGIKKELEHNLDHLEKKLVYHSKLLNDLQTKPLEVVLQLKLPRTKDYAWKLAENEVFRKHIDIEAFYELAEIYSLQEVLKNTNKQAGEAMTHLNVMNTYYFLAAGSKEKAMKMYNDEGFKIGSRSGWIPVFQDVTSYETELIGMYKHFLENH